jgi:hypothetical protein
MQEGQEIKTEQASLVKTERGFLVTYKSGNLIQERTFSVLGGSEAYLFFKKVSQQLH